ncbi:type II toxin-antitoxin system Phd/YefM family antitoxin [Pseudomonas sp. Pf153]|uniref:type II toxin-antitoxin system Phd/YefM family antitoxin n=1 Tax=Pseudomonas sp. Pf153 TaxID=1699309 RepID=UPI00069E0CF6|nr:antitoxin [Pseudomonas sp. Pf153]
MSERVQVDIHQAKSQLSQLAERVWRGDKVVITRAGQPYLELRPHLDTRRVRKPGRLKGRIRMSAEFNQTLDDFNDGFEGGPLEPSCSL